jgi:hypothetical protein
MPLDTDALDNAPAALTPKAPKSTKAAHFMPLKTHRGDLFLMDRESPTSPPTIKSLPYLRNYTGAPVPGII